MASHMKELESLLNDLGYESVANSITKLNLADGTWFSYLLDNRECRGEIDLTKYTHKETTSADIYRAESFTRDGISYKEEKVYIFKDFNYGTVVISIMSTGTIEYMFRFGGSLIRNRYDHLYSAYTSTKVCSPADAMFFIIMHNSHMLKDYIENKQKQELWNLEAGIAAMYEYTTVLTVEDVKSCMQHKSVFEFLLGWQACVESSVEKACIVAKDSSIGIYTDSLSGSASFYSIQSYIAPNQTGFDKVTIFYTCLVFLMNQIVGGAGTEHYTSIQEALSIFNITVNSDIIDAFCGKVFW